MGTIKRVMRADYSSDNVGKYDFKNHIFRRKIDGKLERNYISLKGSTLDGYQKTDLSDRYYTVRTSFIYDKHSTGCRLFSVADYTTKRAFMTSHTILNSKLVIQFWFIVGTNTYSYTLTTSIDTTSIADVEIEYTIDFVDTKIIGAELDRLKVTLPNVTTGVNTSAWTSGQTRTICFGELANYLPNFSTASNAYCYFGQLTDSKNNILLHFDFLGDNDIEILTDKAKLIQLQNSGGATLESRPLDI